MQSLKCFTGITRKSVSFYFQYKLGCLAIDFFELAITFISLQKKINSFVTTLLINFAKNIKK
jgi:hypothetical protein